MIVHRWISFASFTFGVGFLMQFAINLHSNVGLFYSNSECFILSFKVNNSIIGLTQIQLNVLHLQLGIKKTEIFVRNPKNFSSSFQFEIICVSESQMKLLRLLENMKINIDATEKVIEKSNNFSI